MIHKRPDPAESITRSVPDATKKLNFQSSVGAEGFAHLRALCERQHARLAIMPAIRITEPEQDYALIEEFERRWVAFATERGAIALLGPGENTLRGKTYAFDTEYHLNDLGVHQMEGRLAAALLKLFAKPTPAPAPASMRPD